ncbi:hypothetical protein QCA50_014916 [Cerrena zonata]|uniref:Hydrophobin n=1 Tax=Cerrena zonata TaxID=2478898 RepID=A0AAW0FUL0_9APHY
MFSRVSIAVTLALSFLAVATPVPATSGGEPASECNTGPIQCCQSTEAADSTSGAALLGLLGIVLQDVNVLLGVTCSPISVIGVGSSGCSASPVCCTDNSHGGLVSIGCVPVTL